MVRMKFLHSSNGDDDGDDDDADGIETKQNISYKLALETGQSRQPPIPS